MIADSAAAPSFGLRDFLDSKKCFDVLRKKRWPHGVVCPNCSSNRVKNNGHKESEPNCQKYSCKNCDHRFNDLSGTPLARCHHSVCTWILMLYFMGLSLSNQQIAAELNLDGDVAQDMTEKFRKGVYAMKPGCRLKGAIECDEVYVVAGHKGNPAAVRRKNRPGRRNRLKAAPGRGTLEKEKPPILGIIERGGDVALFLLPDVQQITIEPILHAVIEGGSRVHTDEYGICGRLSAWGYDHKRVCHAIDEYARDEDGDGFHEVHVNTIEGFWSLLRSWLRPHRGISQEKLPYYLGFFEFVHNVRRRGKRLLSSLVSLLFAPAA